MAGCRRGEAAAWDTLFDRHYPAAGRFVYQLGHPFSREDVEEICQETFLAVVRALPGFKGHCQFQTWLFRIAANKARDYRQKQNAAKRGGNVVTVSLHEPVPGSHHEVGPAPDPRAWMPGRKNS